MSSGKASPTEKKIRTGARLSDAQEEAIKSTAEKLTSERGTPVAKADVYREALHRYCRDNGVEWPS